MTLPRHQQRLFEAIERQVNSADPLLARSFAAFARRWAGEPLPAREQMRSRGARFWDGLWEALGAGSCSWLWFADPVVTSTAVGTDPEACSADTGPGQGEQQPGQLRRQDRDDRGAR